MALQLIHWNPLRGIELLSPGRRRMIHTNAIAYGFLANAFLGALYWSVPRMTLRPVYNRTLSYFIFAAWQAVVLATAGGILLGQAQGVEWGETPVWVDPVALLGLLLVAVNFMAPITRARGPLYVTLWYFMAAFVWTFLTYAMGNFIPEYVAAGTSGGAVAGLFIHDLVGLFVTPLGWGLMYYFVPVILRKPVWSHGLSLVGFWGLAFFYPLNGIHHFLYTPIPMFLQYGVAHGLNSGVLTSLAVVLVACPCALGLATPLAVWTAVGRAARSQVLFKHGEALEQLAGAAAVCFDKTGTITLGTSRVTNFAVAEDESREAVLEMAASLAASSNHTFSIAITDFALQVAGEELGHAMAGASEEGYGQAMPRCGEFPGHRLASAIDCDLTFRAPDSAPTTTEHSVAEVRTLPGRGISAEVIGMDTTVYLGSRRLMEETGQPTDHQLQHHLERLDERGSPTVCIGWDGHVRGVFELDEKLRPEAQETLDACRQLGLKLLLLSGDATQGAQRLGEKLLVPVEGGLLPDDKVAAVRDLRRQKTPVAMVGDGINDAPALAAADVGISLGCGADVSRESADVCLLSDDLRRVPWSIGLARATVSTIRQNLFWAFAYNILGIALAASGRLNPVWAAAAMVASSVLVIGNSLRLSTWNF